MPTTLRRSPPSIRPEPVRHRAVATGTTSGSRYWNQLEPTRRRPCSPVPFFRSPARPNFLILGNVWRSRKVPPNHPATRKDVDTKSVRPGVRFRAMRRMTSSVIIARIANGTVCRTRTRPRARAGGIPPRSRRSRATANAWNSQRVEPGPSPYTTQARPVVSRGPSPIGNQGRATSRRSA